MKTEKLETYMKGVINHYEKKCLTPLFGEGKVKETLLEGLVESLEENYKKFPEIKRFVKKLDFHEIEKYMGRQNIVNALKSNGIETYEDLESFGTFGLLKLRGLGRNSYDKFMAYLSEKGFSF